MIAGLLTQTRDSIRGNLPTLLSGVITTSFALIMVGTFVLVYLNLMQLTQLFFRQSQYSVFLQHHIEASPYQTVLRYIRSELKGASQIREISAQQARAALIDSFGEAKELLNRHDFPQLPHIIEFVLARPEALSETELRQLLSFAGVEEVVTGRETRAQIDTFFNIARFVGLFLIGLLLVSVTQIIHNAIQISIRIRIKEIEVLKILGATSAFIRRPYILEGILIAITSSFFSLAIIFILFQFVSAGITFNEATYSLKTVVVFFSLPQMGLIFVVLIILGAVSSLFATNKIIGQLDI